MLRELSVALAGRDVAPDVLDDALLVVSELVSNAVRGGCRKA